MSVLCTDTVLDSVPLHRVAGVDPDSFTSRNTTNKPSAISQNTNTTSSSISSRDTHPHSPPFSSPSSSPTSCVLEPSVTVVPPPIISRILTSLTQQQEPEALERPGETELTDQTLHLLLLATLEGVSTQSGGRTAAQLGSALRLLSGLTSLFEEAVGLWLKLHNQTTTDHTTTDQTTTDHTTTDHTTTDHTDLTTSDSTSETANGALIEGAPSYQGVVHVARTVLRLWVVLASDILTSNLSPQQAAEATPLLSSPILTISRTCYNLRHLFSGNEVLDQEFTLMVLETSLACLHAANLLGQVVTCPGEDVVAVFGECLSDGFHEWFTYLCSKLHALAESGVNVDSGSSSWVRVTDTSHSLLAGILGELICTAEHVRIFQRASKSALSGETAVRPITYTVGLSRNFDRLTLRMSKLANIVLDCFKQVSSLQLLSLHLLSETASDTVEIIGNFLGNILDPVIRANSEVLDHYLELLENVWFRLSPDYSGSAPLWKKLTNYFTLIWDTGRGVLHQVLYHLQCLFSHDSLTLKSQLTVHVVLPLHTHLIATVREKVYGNRMSSGEKSGHIGRADVEWTNELETALSEEERTLVSLHLKLLLKVVSHQSSLQSFLSDTGHLYSLFLLLPIPSFCPPTLSVAEQCFKTLQTPSPSTSGDSQRQDQTTASPTSSSDTRKTLLKIFLKLGFSMPVDKLMNLCLAIADGKVSLVTFNYGAVDTLHKRLQDIYEAAPLGNLLTGQFLSHMSIIRDVWEILARLAPCGPLVLAILRDNTVVDFVKISSPILGTLLARVQQQVEGGVLEGGDGAVCSLRELAVALLSSLLSMAHFLFWQRREAAVYTNNACSVLFCASFVCTRVLTTHLFLTVFVSRCIQVFLLAYIKQSAVYVCVQIIVASYSMCMMCLHSAGVGGTM